MVSFSLFASLLSFHVESYLATSFVSFPWMSDEKETTLKGDNDDCLHGYSTQELSSFLTFVWLPLSLETGIAGKGKLDNQYLIPKSNGNREKKVMEEEETDPPLTTKFGNEVGPVTPLSSSWVWLTSTAIGKDWQKRKRNGWRSEHHGEHGFISVFFPTLLCFYFRKKR